MTFLGSNLTGFIFEQEYQRKDERVPVIKLASALDTFFQAIPPETRYHIELRTETYLTNPVFEVFGKTRRRTGAFPLDLAAVP
jgi:hypothetical protein